MQHQLHRLLHLSPQLYRIRNQTIVRNQGSSRDLNSIKMRLQTEDRLMQTTHRSGNTINSTRYFPKILLLAHLRLLLRETAMAPHKVKDQSKMVVVIITSSKITTQLVNHKMPTINPNHNRMGVPILIRVFPQLVIQVVTTITEALLPTITAVITW